MIVFRGVPTSAIGVSKIRNAVAPRLGNTSGCLTTYAHRPLSPIAISEPMNVYTAFPLLRQCRVQPSLQPVRAWDSANEPCAGRRHAGIGELRDVINLVPRVEDHAHWRASLTAPVNPMSRYRDRVSDL